MSSPQGFVIRAEGLCGFQIRSYITWGLTNCLPLSRLGIAQASLASPLAAPSVTNPREPKSREPKAFQADSFRFRFRLRVFLSAIVFTMRKYTVYDYCLC